ncbi:MAG UNVERIFIED_CONTAM: hypothetical protein LVR29_03625 [Microcystis novacekii LVE1205-3]
MNLFPSPEFTWAIEAGDGVIFYNFRPDRARQLCYALTMPDFEDFDSRFNFSPQFCHFYPIRSEITGRCGLCSPEFK